MACEVHHSPDALGVVGWHFAKMQMQMANYEHLFYLGQGQLNHNCISLICQQIENKIMEITTHIHTHTHTYTHIHTHTHTHTYTHSHTHTHT